MRPACRLFLAVAVAMLVADHAIAQTPPRSGDAAVPDAAMPGAGDPQGGPSMSAPGGATLAGGVSACHAEFDKLRAEAERRGQTARAAGEDHASRAEICRTINRFVDAEAKWGGFAAANASSCGIPVAIVDELEALHSNTERARQRICSAIGPDGASGLHVDPVRLDMADHPGM